MIYHLFGWWFRWQACKMAAQIMQGQGMGSDTEGCCPKLWSATVFFERYLCEGAEYTMQEFGPKEPIELKSVVKSGEKL